MILSFAMRAGEPPRGRTAFPPARCCGLHGREELLGRPLVQRPLARDGGLWTAGAEDVVADYISTTTDLAHALEWEYVRGPWHGRPAPPSPRLVGPTLLDEAGRKVRFHLTAATSPPGQRQELQSPIYPTPDALTRVDPSEMDMSGRGGAPGDNTLIIGRAPDGTFPWKSSRLAWRAFSCACLPSLLS